MILVTFLCCMLVPLVHGLEVGEDTPISPGDQAWLNSLFYLPETPRIRKEYRMLSDEERKTFNGAFLKLKQDKSVSPNKYDLLASLHARRSSRNSAHRGPGFLAWHRVYTLLMENALREKEANITMAYWDSTLDAGLALPRESCLWSEDFMGNGDGFVNVGVFKDWSTQADKLYRTVGIINGPLEEKNITRLFKFHHIGNISYPQTTLKDKEDIFELTHNRVHRWIGGEMQLIETAADDPIFFIYHSFVSLVWEDFRAQQRSKGIDPETDWDLYYGAARHHKYSPMGLGNLMAIDGNSEIFAENIVFEKRPSCSKVNTDCGSPYLYCNVSIAKCVTWTLREYDMLKEIAVSKSVLFKTVAKEYIQRKVSGVVDLFADEESEVHDNDDMKHGHSHNDGHNENMMNEYIVEGHDDDDDEVHDDDHHYEVHDDDHSEDDDDDNHSEVHDDHSVVDDDHSEVHDDDSDEDDHHHHDHNTFVETLVHAGKHAGTIIEENLPMIILAGTLLVLIILSIVSKCVVEKRGRGTRKGKYRMDGIINVNYADNERNKDKRRRENPSETRSDNIYTITVTSNTSNTGTPETFVRFAKFDKQSETQVSGSSTPQAVELTSRNKSDYLDMDYASRIMNEAKSCASDLYEISLDNSDHEGERDIELETTYNSIENENFDLTCSHDNSQPCEQQCYDNATKSIDDVLADYDNLVFRTEPKCSSSTTQSPYDFGDLDNDDDYLTCADLQSPSSYM